MKSKLLGTIVACLICSIGLNAQQLLRPEEAVAIGLKQNYAIKMAETDLKIAGNMSTPGNAGFLPTIQFAGGTSFQDNNIKQEFSNGLLVDKRSVGSSNLNAGIGLTWTLFDGSKMFVNWKKLNENENLSRHRLKISMENTIVGILNAYYDLVRINQEIKAMEFECKLAEQVQLIAKVKMESGSGIRQQYLQAQVDQNTCASAIMQLKLSRENGKSKLNELLSRELTDDFLVLDTIETSYEPSLPDLQNNLLSNNSRLLLEKTNKSLSALLVREQTSNLFPNIGLVSGFNYSKNRSEGGFALFNQATGPSLGLRMNWNLYNGGMVNTNIKNARLQLLNQDLSIKKTELMLSAELIMAYRKFKNTLELWALEKQNFNAAKENLMLSGEIFKTGNSDILPVKEAERSYYEAILRLTQSALDAKKSEIELMRLSGDLVK